MCVKRSGDCHSSNGNHPEYAASPLGGCRLGRCTHGRCDGLAILHPAAVAAQDSAGAAINAATGDLSQRLVIDPAQIRSGSHDPVVIDAHNALISGMHDTAGATPRGIPTLFSGFASVTEFLAALDAAGLPSALQEIAVIRDGIRVSSAGRIAVDDAAIEVYQLDGPDAVAAVLDGFRGEGGVTFPRPANVTLWGSGALLVILVNAPASARISRSHVPRTTRVAHGSGSWAREASALRLPEYARDGYGTAALHVAGHGRRSCHAVGVGCHVRGRGPHRACRPSCRAGAGCVAAG